MGKRLKESRAYWERIAKEEGRAHLQALGKADFHKKKQEQADRVLAELDTKTECTCGGAMSEHTIFDEDAGGAVSVIECEDCGTIKREA